MFHGVWHNLKATKGEENWLQFCNPFRLAINAISLPLKIVIFIGHVVGEGVTADILHPVPAVLTAIVNTLDEVAQDYHYIFPFEEHDHAHHGEHEHGHNHSDLPGTFIKICLAPVYLLSSLWDYSFGYLPSRNDDFRNRYHRTLNQSIKRSFNIEWPSLLKSGAHLAAKIKNGLITLLPARIWPKSANDNGTNIVELTTVEVTTEINSEPKTSESWRRIETYQRVSAEVKRLGHGTNPLKKSAKAKITILGNVTNNLIKDNATSSSLSDESNEGTSQSKQLISDDGNSTDEIMIANDANGMAGKRR